MPTPRGGPSGLRKRRQSAGAHSIFCPQRYHVKESNQPLEKTARPAFYTWWSTQTGTGVALAILVLACAGLIFGQLSTLGIWQPWESDEIRIAREYSQRDAPDESDESDESNEPAAASVPEATTDSDAPKPNWVTPTLDGKPVARPLLKTWILAATVGDPAELGDYQIGELERSARLPIALGVFLLILLSFAWIRRYFDTWSALLCALAFTTIPATFLGVHSLSSEMLFVVISSASILAYSDRSRSKTARARCIWRTPTGTMLSISVLEKRYCAPLSPLTVSIPYCVTKLPCEQIPRARENP